MDYLIRKATAEDLYTIETIYEYARRFMADHDNPEQWGEEYPSAELIQHDILERKLYVLTDGNVIHGVFYFSIEADPTYADIYEGRWSSDSTYGVIHRIAGDGSGGILHTAVEYARKQIRHLRIDTHSDNYVMQRALEKLGFHRRGIIYIEDGSSRIAYDWMEGVREAQDSDLQEILNLYLHLHETLLPEDKNTLNRTWMQILDDSNHHLIVYEKEGRIVSSCVCVVIPNLSRNLRPYALIENVVTHTAYRGRGYATACLNYAREVAVKNGCYKIMLLTGAKDSNILSFYRNAGYNSNDKTAFIQWLDM